MNYTKPDISTLLSSFGEFSDLNGQTLNRLTEKISRKFFKKNEFIYLPDDPSLHLYLLKEGKVKVGKYSEEGKEMILRVNHDGDIFGELSLIPNECRGNFAQVTHGTAEVWIVSIQDIQDLMREDFDFSLRMTHIIGKKLIKTEKRMETLIFKDAKSRIVEFIKRIAGERGIPIGKETLIKTSLTHLDIAKLTATSRQTVTTTLNELKERNLIYFDRRRILVRDMGALK